MNGDTLVVEYVLLLIANSAVSKIKAVNLIYFSFLFYFHFIFDLFSIFLFLELRDRVKVMIGHGHKLQDMIEESRRF